LNKNEKQTVISKLTDLFLNLYLEKSTNIIIICWMVTSFHLPIIRYFFINREKIGEDKNNKIEEKNGNFGFADNNPKVFILPMYLLWIFSLSKLIIIFVKDSNQEAGEDIWIKVSILSIIFIGSLWA